MEDKKTISPYLSDKIMYGFGFLGGLLFLVLGSLLYILPLIFIGDSSLTVEALLGKITEYQAFPACACEILGISVFVIFFRKVFVSDFKDFIKGWKKYLIVIIVCSALIYGSSYLFEYIYDLFDINTDSANQESIVQTLFGKGKFAMIFQVALIAPIFEEILFRKFAFGFLRELKLGRVLSFLLVAFVFALIHCSSENFLRIDAYVYLLNYFVLSSILTAAYVFCKDNIYASIIVHMFNNILSLLVVYGVINVIV